MRCLSLTLLLILFPVSGFAQIPLAVNGDSEGSVARQLIYQLEREIEDHGDYSLADSEETHLMTLEIRAMPYAEGSDEATAYSLTWTVPNSGTEAGLEVFYGSTVGYCGYDRVEGTARELVRRTDRYVSNLAEAMEAEGDI